MASDHPAVTKALERSGYAQLNPAQSAAVRSGLLEGKSVVVAAPTASGKTLIAEIAALEAIKRRRKVVYLVPLRALASEKHDEFKQRYEPLGIRVALSSGDYDSTDAWLGSADWIVATAEKMDSLLRHGVPWARDIGLVVADELHLLNDPERGPTLEVVLTRLRQLSAPAVLGLSATISNYQELADWLRADAVASDYRPVPLYYGVAYEREAAFRAAGSRGGIGTGIKRGESQRVAGSDFKMELATLNHLEELTKYALGLGKQQLVFAGTRKGAQATAELLGAIVKPRLSAEERATLAALAEKVRTALEHPTAQCLRLASCVADGAAFHHAGLAPAQRKLVEAAFRGGALKAISATPTLAAGLNLPSFLTIVRDLKRFSSFRGMDYLPVLEVQQMLGRAGRPQYDEQGLGVLLAKSEGEARYAWEHYVTGESEQIFSKLGVEPVLRTHVLGLVASGAAPTTADLQAFFSKTFYAHQYKEPLDPFLDRVLNMLERLGFVSIEQGEKADFVPADLLLRKSFSLAATRLGKRVAELYLDPLSAEHLINALHVFAARKEQPSALALLHAIAGCRELKPLVSVRKGDREWLDELLASGPDLVQQPPAEWDNEFEEYLQAVKTAKVLEAWADEVGEDKVMERYGVSPGELHARLNNADWVLYAAQELALLLGHKALLTPLRKLRIRVSSGVREELLPLIALKGIGRVRARKLYASGFVSLAALRTAPVQALARLVGEKTAESIREQVSRGEVQGTLAT